MRQSCGYHRDGTTQSPQIALHHRDWMELRNNLLMRTSSWLQPGSPPWSTRLPELLEEGLVTITQDYQPGCLTALGEGRRLPLFRANIHKNHCLMFQSIP